MGDRWHLQTQDNSSEVPAELLQQLDSHRHQDILLLSQIPVYPQGLKNLISNFSSRFVWMFRTDKILVFQVYNESLKFSFELQNTTRKAHDITAWITSYLA